MPAPDPVPPAPPPPLPPPAPAPDPPGPARSADADAFERASGAASEQDEQRPAGPAVAAAAAAPITPEEEKRARGILKAAFKLLALLTSTKEFELTDPYCDAMGTDRPAAECARLYLGILGPEKQLGLALAPHALAAASVYQQHLTKQREELMTYLRGRAPARAPADTGDGRAAAPAAGATRFDLRTPGVGEDVAPAVVLGTPIG